MTQVHHIRYLAFHKGKSLRSIVRDTGHDFKTVKKYVEKDDWNEEVTERKKKPSKLDPYKPIIDNWLKEDLNAPLKQRHTAQRVYDRLCEIYEDFNVSLRIVQYYVSNKKKELFDSSEGYLPLEHTPGEAQADFGEVLLEERGKNIKGYYFNLSFPYSNAAYCQVFKGQNQECLLEGLKRVFEYTSFVPKKIWFDNLSAAVKEIKKNGDRKLIEQFEKFSLHYGFEHNFCNPNSGHEKGHVENKVGYNRRNFFVPVPQFDDIEEFNKTLFEKADIDMQRKHYKKGIKISNLFKEDINNMIPLGEKPFEVCRIVKSKANKWGKIEFDNNTYSASPAVSLKEVWVKASHNTVTIMDEDYKKIVVHERRYGKKQEAMNWYPYLELMSKRPNAIKYTSFYRKLPDPWSEYLNQCEYEEKKDALKLLLKMLEFNNIETATEALKKTLENGVKDTDSIYTTWHRLTNNIPDPPDLNIDEIFPETSEFEPDLNIYDSLLKEGEAR